MPISQTVVKGQIRTPDNLPAEIVDVIFTLNAVDYEDGVAIARKPLSVTKTGAGTFTIELWPNDAGRFGTTRYRVSYLLANGATVPAYPEVFIPASPQAQNLEDLVLATMFAIRGYTFRVISEFHFTNLSDYSEGSIYLVKKGERNA